MKKLFLVYAVLMTCFPFADLAAQSIHVKVTLAGSGLVLTENVNPSAPASVSDADGNRNLELSDYMLATSLSYEMEQPGSVIVTGGGSGVGKITFSPLVITKTVDAASAQLMLAQARGRILELEILFVAQGGEQSNVVYKILLGSAGVKNFSGASAGECSTCPLAESFSFEYGTIKVYTYSQGTDGRFTVNAPFGWDRIRNVEF